MARQQWWGYTHVLIGYGRQSQKWKIVQWCSSYDVANHTYKKEIDTLLYTEMMILPVETLDESLMLLNGE